MRVLCGRRLQFNTGTKFSTYDDSTVRDNDVFGRTAAAGSVLGIKFQSKLMNKEYFL